ncbi:MAG: radical SAM protein [Planctomycetaceae bacterium]|jgi:hypothetical protein|nr:radical SAM protein [Planctomycetaceae bacterium]
MIYRNGNTTVLLCPDGTKIRHTPDGQIPQPVRPESIDIKITDYCENNCWFCYEHSNNKGTHSDLQHPILETLEAGTELAIGGGNPLSHPDIESFLKRMKTKGVICNLTVHQNDYNFAKPYIIRLMIDRYVHGLGISVGDKECNVQIADKIKDRVLFHTILGITPLDVITELSQRNKVLLLGSKRLQPNNDAINGLRDFIVNKSELIVGLYFDNLACEQLDVRSLVDTETWNKRYMGGDGIFTMYIDLVKEYGYTSSVDKSVSYALSESPNIRNLFAQIRQNTIG